MKMIIKRALPVLLAVLLLAYALKDISFSEMAVQFRKANYAWIGLYGLTALFTYFLRGKRWQQPLLALGHHPTAFRTTIAFQAGMTASMIVIGTGELTRCATLQRTDNIPFAHSMGSIVAERVLDMIMLLIILSLTFLLEVVRMKAYFAAVVFATPFSTAGIVAGGSLLATGVVYWLWRNPAIRRHPLTRKISTFAKELWAGFLAIRQLPHPAFFVALTVLIQIMGWLSTYILLRSVEATHFLPPVAALTVLAVSSLGGLAVPTQGGIGTYHFLVSRALALYGLTLTQGVVAATFLHAVGFSINLLLSSLSFLILPVLIQRQTGMNPQITK